jgi:hypothetical protein
MKVYVAGPMTGFPAYNHAAFAEAQARWRAAGHDVVTPFDANSRVWHRHYRRSFDPYTDRCEYGDPLLREMFAEDVATLLSCDAVAVLPGWERSSGVARELPIALLFKIPIHDAATFEVIPLATVIQFVRTDESALEEAQRLVHGNRGADYGHPIDDYTRTGRIWGAILGIPDIDPRICCLMMAGVKVSREVNKSKRDNRVDLAGYAECAEMVAERQKATSIT